jgi:hypothetical protein
MIHQLLLRLGEKLPLYPPAVALAAGVLAVVLCLWLFGRSRETALVCVIVAVLATGLAAGLFGLDRASSPIFWGRFEDVADRYVGPASFRRWEQITAGSLLLAAGALALLYNLATQEQPGERPRRQLRRDANQSTALGNAHLCLPQTFRRWSRHDPWGWTLQGQFWGENDHSLGRRFSLSGEDIARGIAVFGPQGSGKTQCVILPAIADRMRDGHSLIVTDVQGELQPYIEKLAAATGHVIVVHDPSNPKQSCHLNLCRWITSVVDAQATAAVLLSESYRQNQNPFWTQAATNLLAASALHYPNVSAIVIAHRDERQMAKDLQHSQVRGVADLAADFVNSMLSGEPRLAHNIASTAFIEGLSPWAEPDLWAITDDTNVNLDQQLIQVPTVFILRYSGHHIKTYGPYLGAILHVLIARLDALAQKKGGALPIPVGLILEEFPALGRLDSLLRNINLVRKRRISILTAAQSLAQFEHIYPGQGETDQLLAGLATKIVFGGCDKRTADFFSDLSGQQTLTLSSVSHTRRLGGQAVAGSTTSSTASLHTRALLLPDDLIRPTRGHATLFAAYSQDGRADQAILHARLTPFFKAKQWKKLKRIEPRTPVAAGPSRITFPAGPKPQETPGLSEQRQLETLEIEDLSLDRETDELSSAVAQELEIGL